MVLCVDFFFFVAHSLCYSAAEDFLDQPMSMSAGFIANIVYFNSVTSSDWKLSGFDLFSLDTPRVQTEISKLWFVAIIFHNSIFLFLRFIFYISIYKYAFIYGAFYDVCSWALIYSVAINNK